MANWYEDKLETSAQRHSRERNEAHDRHEQEHAAMNGRHEAELTQMARRQNAERAITPDDVVNGGQTAEPSNLSPGFSDWSPNLIDQRTDVRRMAYAQATTPEKLTLEGVKTDGGRTPRFSRETSASRVQTPDDSRKAPTFWRRGALARWVSDDPRYAEYQNPGAAGVANNYGPYSGIGPYSGTGLEQWLLMRFGRSGVKAISDSIDGCRDFNANKPLPLAAQ